MGDVDAKETIEVLNIVVCYHNVNEIVNYALTIDKQRRSERIALCIVICDGTDRCSFESIGCHNLVILVYDAKANAGYMRGAILGYSYASRTMNTSFKWIIISNADIDYENTTFFADLLKKDLSQSIGCIGPDIYVPGTDEHQNPALYNRMPFLRLAFYVLVFSFGPTAKLYITCAEKRRKVSRHVTNDCYVYMVHGAYFILKEEVLRKMLATPYEAFLFSEELYVAEILRLMNLKTYYSSGLKIIHKEHSTTSNLSKTSRYKALRDSYLYILKQFYFNR